MHRERIKDVFEGAGFLAVIASLVFVGIETRNNAIQAELNTEAVQMAAYQELIQSINDMNALAIQEPLLRSGVRNAIGNPNEVTTEEADVLSWWLWMRIRHGDMAYFQYQRGAIDESRLRSVISPLMQILDSDYGRDEWRLRQTMFEPAYRDFVNEILDDLEATGQPYSPFPVETN